MKIWLYSEETKVIEALRIQFRDPIQYFIGTCADAYAPLPKEPPTQLEKTWTFTRTSKGVKYECDGVEVLDFELTPEACGEEAYKKWEQRITHIRFDSHASDASDFYRPLLGNVLLVVPLNQFI